jgi:hypothetical protein
MKDNKNIYGPKHVSLTHINYSSPSKDQRVSRLCDALTSINLCDAEGEFKKESGKDFERERRKSPGGCYSGPCVALSCETRKLESELNFMKENRSFAFITMKEQILSKFSARIFHNTSLNDICS